MTYFYLQLIQTVLENQKQVRILVPEINLTPQLFERFQCRFKVNITTLHSSLNHKNRFQNWLAAIDGSAKIVIGTRSAIFTPMPHLGLIILSRIFGPSPRSDKLLVSIHSVHSSGGFGHSGNICFLISSHMLSPSSCAFDQPAQKHPSS
mgnify:CR=1 FL=1